MPIPTGAAKLVADVRCGDADDIAAVLHARVDRWTTNNGARAAEQTPPHRWTPPGGRIWDRDLARGLTERATLIEQRAEAVVEQAINNAQLDPRPRAATGE